MLLALNTVLLNSSNSSTVQPSNYGRARDRIILAVIQERLFYTAQLFSLLSCQQIFRFIEWPAENRGKLCNWPMSGFVCKINN